MTCPWCNDEGVVHSHDGIELGPCDCAAPTSDGVSEPDYSGRAPAAPDERGTAHASLHAVSTSKTNDNQETNQ